MRRALPTKEVSWLNLARSQRKTINKSKGCLIFHITVQAISKGWDDSAADTNLKEKNKIQGWTCTSLYSDVQVEGLRFLVDEQKLKFRLAWKVNLIATRK